MRYTEKVETIVHLFLECNYFFFYFLRDCTYLTHNYSTVKLWNFVRNFDINIYIFLNAFHVLCKYLHENMINDIYLIFFPINLLISLTPTTSHSLQINFYELCSFINTPQSLKRLSCASSEGHRVSVFVLEGFFWTINEESSLHLRFTFNEVFLT